MKESLLIEILKENLKEKYDFNTGDNQKDISNCINILYKEIYQMYKVGLSIQDSVDYIDSIIEDNELNLCPFCADKENSNYATLQNILQTGLGELERIHTAKEVNLYCILTIMIQSNLQGIECLFDYTADEINSLSDNQTISVITKAHEKLIEKALSSKDYIDYFSFIVRLINEELDEVL